MRWSSSVSLQIVRKTSAALLPTPGDAGHEKFFGVQASSALESAYPLFGSLPHCERFEGGGPTTEAHLRRSAFMRESN